MGAVILFVLLGLAARVLGGVPSGRVVNGSLATQGQFPFMVSVQHSGLLFKRHICGGVIINDNHVLTTASCVSGELTINLNVVAGEQTLHQNSNLEEEKHVQRVFLHENFDSATLSNDIAILRTSHNFVFVHDLIQMAPLPAEATAEEPANGDPATIVGWGLTMPTEDKNNDLHYGDATYLSREACKEVYGSAVTETNGCLESQSSGTCNGDEGGPVIVGGEVVGLVSWRKDCTTSPTVTTSVIPFLGWINSHLEA